MVYVGAPIQTRVGSSAGGDRSDSTTGLALGTWKVGWTFIEAASYTTAWMTMRSTHKLQRQLPGLHPEQEFLCPEPDLLPRVVARCRAGPGNKQGVRWGSTGLHGRTKGLPHPLLHLPGEGLDDTRWRKNWFGA